MLTIASTPPFSPHSARSDILGEAHARPFFSLDAPARVIGFAFLRGETPPEMLRERLDAFARLNGVAPAPRHAKHHRMQLPQAVFRWEEHTEFTTYIFLLSGEASEFSRGGSDLLKALPLPEQPGPHLVSIDIAVVGGAEEAEALKGLQASVVSMSEIDQGAARVASDFIPDHGGMVRFVLTNLALPARRLGALARDVIEIEVYRSLALLALPEARRVTPILREVEQSLADLMRDLVHQTSLEAGDALLARLTDMTARVENAIAETKFRFGATRAYGAILNDRLAGFAKPATAAAPAIEAFLTRRNAPALRTCETMEAALGDLAARLNRASSLLRTRVDVELAKQNNAILGSLNARSQTQLRLQQTVEGLSVAAISYYVVGLGAYLIKGVKDAHLLPVSLDVAIGVLVPVTVLVMMGVMRRIRGRE